jgi:hypothetical protein
VATTVDQETVSLRQAVVWYAGRYAVPGAVPERNENLKKLLGAQIEQWHRAGAPWVTITGSGAGKRICAELPELADALEQLPRCEATDCPRPALRHDGRCGSCGYGRTGRPREHEWKIRTCTGCGKTEDAPLYGGQQRWWCDDCNGRQKHEPHECEHPGCDRIVRGRRRFCGRAHAMAVDWSMRTPEHRAEILAPAHEALRERWRAALAITERPEVLRMEDVAKRLHVSKWTPYNWREAGWLPVIEQMGGRLLTADEDGLRALIRTLARLNQPRLLDPKHASAPARVVLLRRQLILPHRAGAPRKDELRAEWRRLFYEVRSSLDGWSDFQICVSVAERHLRTCADPAVWAKYPRTADGGLRPEDERKAGQRVWAAIS